MGASHSRANPVLKLKQKSANKRPMTFTCASQLLDYLYFPYLNPNHWNQPFSAHIRSVRSEALRGASGEEHPFILCPFQDHRPAKSLHRHQSSPRLGSLPPPRQPSSVLIPVLIRSILFMDAHGFYSGGFQGGKVLLNGVVEKFITK